VNGAAERVTSVVIPRRLAADRSGSAVLPPTDRSQRSASPRTVHHPAWRPAVPVGGPVAAPPARLDAGPAPAPARVAGAASGWVLPLSIVTLGSFMALLDTSIVNVAISRIQGEFGGSTTDVQWIATAYTLTLGVVVPTTAWLSNRFGLQRVYVVAVAWFTLGSALCGVAASLDTLIAFRVFQAIGGGLMPVLAQSMIYQMVPREGIGSAIGLYGLGIVVAPAVGPSLGGWLVTDVNWRLIFYINVPIGVLVTLLSLTLLPRFARGAARRFDLPGFLFIGGGLACLLIAFSEGENWHWTSYAVLLLLVGGVLCLTIFAVIELSVNAPLLDLRLFGGWVFSLSVVLVGLVSVGLFAGAFYIPLFLQQGQGLNALDAGLTLLLPAVVTTVMMPISGRLYDRVGARWPAAVGLVLVAAGTYTMHIVTPQMGRTPIILANCIRNGGIGLALIPIITGATSSLPLARTGQASAVLNVVQQMAAALGLAALTALLTAHEAQQYLAQASLLPAPAPGFPQLDAVAANGQAAILGLYDTVQNQTFAGGLDDVFLLTAAVSAIGVLLALLLPTGSPLSRARKRAATAGEELPGGRPSGP
jgi:EmrB/QacA subfamily drug resistance transporter